ncbi:sulfatase family protein [Pedobacter sp. MW01-1-1]|uniref:sulfatase family protein n=1 Tax=Pedobacter sp. MW01-1-1 TaxID=3383027 RepID=UPI003FEE6368
MMKTASSFAFFMLFFVFFSAAQKNKSTAKPNVILIYIDDLGYGDLSCYGATKIATPNTDKLAKNGLKFTNGHCTSATCTPSRYALMSGEYPWRDKGHNILPGDAALIVSTTKLTLPKVFKKAGYETGIVGKWHLGLSDQVTKDWNADIKPGPNEVGFDYSFIFPATADRVPTVFMENHRVIGLDPKDSIFVDYKKKIGTEPTGKENPELLKLNASVGHNQTIVNGIGRIGFMQGGKKTRWTDEELAPTFLSKAQNFIENNQKKPFFLYFALNDIHVPRMPASMFKGKSALGYRGDAILEMDWMVGEITKQLDRLGLTKNTMIIFSSDNGPVLDDGYADDAEVLNGTHKPAGPYRGWKTDIYEGGTRIPFIISWPAKIKAGTSNALVNQMDFVASFSAFFNQSTPAGEAKDSQNLWPVFVGSSQAGRTTMVEEGYSNLAIVHNDWKYIEPYRKVPAQLYNLKDDVGEKNNVIDKFPEIKNELESLLNKEKSK